MNSPPAPRLIVSALLILVFTGHAFAAEVLVAAASDLNFPIKEIISQFEQKTGSMVKLTLGSSGSFQAQIANGAPFDVYLSADVDYVRQLERSGLIEPGSLYVYAVGRLVIWVPNVSPIDVQKLGMDSLLQPSARRIAIAESCRCSLRQGCGRCVAPFQPLRSCCFAAGTWRKHFANGAVRFIGCCGSRNHRPFGGLG